MEATNSRTAQYNREQTLVFKNPETTQNLNTQSAANTTAYIQTNSFLKDAFERIKSGARLLKSYVIRFLKFCRSVITAPFKNSCYPEKIEKQSIASNNSIVDAFIDKSLPSRLTIDKDKILGSGSYGVVNAGKLYNPDTNTYTNVAVKTLHKEDPDGEQTLQEEKYRQEVCNMLKVKTEEAKDHFTQILGAYKCDKTNSYVMIFELGSTDMTQYVKKKTDKHTKPLEVSIVSRVLCGLLECIKKGIELGVIHEEINGCNMILFIPENKIKFTDMAKMETNLERITPKNIFYVFSNYVFRLINDMILRKQDNTTIENYYTSYTEKNKIDIFNKYFKPKLLQYKVSSNEQKRYLKAFKKDIKTKEELVRELWYTLYKFNNISLTLAVIDVWIDYIKANLGYAETLEN